MQQGSADLTRSVLEKLSEYGQLLYATLTSGCRLTRRCRWRSPVSLLKEGTTIQTSGWRGIRFHTVLTEHTLLLTGLKEELGYVCVEFNKQGCCNGESNEVTFYRCEMGTELESLLESIFFFCFVRFLKTKCLRRWSFQSTDIKADELKNSKIHQKQRFSKTSKEESTVNTQNGRKRKRFYIICFPPF